VEELVDGGRKIEAISADSERSFDRLVVSWVYLSADIPRNMLSGP
jgi:hypothetical protein